MFTITGVQSSTPLDVAIVIQGGRPLLEVKLMKGYIKIKYREANTQKSARKVMLQVPNKSFSEEDVASLISEVYLAFGKVDDEFWNQLIEAMCITTGASLIPEATEITAATL